MSSTEISTTFSEHAGHRSAGEPVGLPEKPGTAQPGIGQGIAEKPTASVSGQEFTSDPAEMRSAFSGFPSGVAALAAMVGGDPVVMICSSFSVGVSYDPPMVSFAVQRSSTTWPVLAAALAIGVSILGEGHSGRTSQLASRDKGKRLSGLRIAEAASGAIFLSGSPMQLECVVEHRYPAGDHDIIVLRVVSLRSDDSPGPLVWHQRRSKTLAG